MQFHALKEACASGRTRLRGARVVYFNLARLFGNDSLAGKLTSHYSAIFDFDNLEEAARESAVRQSLMHRWHSRPAGSDVFVCDLQSLERALNVCIWRRIHPMG